MFALQYTQSPIARRFIDGISWSLVGSVGSQGFVILGALLVARMEGQQAYGQFVLMQSTLTMVGVFAGFGIGSTASRYIAALKQTQPVRLGRILALTQRAVLFFGLVMSAAMAIASPYLANNLLENPALEQPLLIASSGIFFAALDGFYKSTLIGFEAMRSYAYSAIIGCGASSLLLVLAAHFFSVGALAAALFAGSFVQSIISFRLARAHYKIAAIDLEGKNCISEWRILRDFALPAMLAGALIMPAHWLVQVFLAKTTNGYNEIALLGVAMQWFNLIIFLPSVAARVITPILTQYIVEQNHKNSIYILKFSIIINSIVVIPMAILFIIFSSSIMGLYGTEFGSGKTAFAVAVATAALLAIQSPVGAIIAATSRMWLGMIMNFGWAIIYIAGSYLLRDYGAIGILSSLAAGYIIHSIWTFRFALNELQSKG